MLNTTQQLNGHTTICGLIIDMYAIKHPQSLLGVVSEYMAN